jgi:hypothetical protein
MTLRSCLLFAAVLAAVSFPAAAGPASISGLTVDKSQGSLVIGAPDKAAIAAAFDSLPEGLRAYAQMGAQLFAQAIHAVHDQATVNSAPVPAAVRQALAPYFPAEVFDHLRWTVDDPNRFSLTTVMSVTKDVEAVTLDDLITFANCRLPHERLDLWAHEIVHVLQYHLMGIDDFATVYLATGGDALEKQAYDWQGYVGEKLKGQAPAWAPGEFLPPGC